MSKYTTEVRFICETVSGLTESNGFDNVENILTASAPKIFDFPFPIFDEEYRLPLERKILRHYYTREICEETVGLWKLRISARLNEIMPYYNKLYESELLKFNPLYDTDLYTKNDGTTEGNRSGNVDAAGNSRSTTNNSNTAWQLYSDTPQGGLNGVRDENYLTNATKNTNDGTTTTNTDTTDNTTSNENTKTTEDYLQHVYGNKGGKGYAEMLTDFRKTFLNIDMQIIDELKDLFFGLW